MKLPITFLLQSFFALSFFTASAAEPTNPFFPFCIDWHDSQKRTFEQQAQMLKELGYPGVGHIWLDKIEERLATLDAAGLRLFQITMPVDLAPGKAPYDAARFKEVLVLIKGRQVQFCLLVKGGSPSDPALDGRAVEVFREMSELAKDSGAQLLLYPHQKDWIERHEDSIRVAEKVDRPNVGVMFNLCHWLRVDSSRDYRPLLQRAMPRLWAVSVNGADERDEQPGWKRYIQPLDQGTFDVGALLKTLTELGYRGPVGLQCFGIGGDAREHLARSMTKWRTLHAAVGPGARGARAEATPNLTLPPDQRPEWLRRDGIVMAGSWEPLLFRVRRDGAAGYTPTAEQRAAYEREHSPAMIARLKELGVNFVMMHCYKGGGLEAERESMDDAVKFAKLCHDAGLRVGCYTSSGAFIWELFFKEMPQAKDWLVRNPDGTPITYSKAGYRYYWNRNHPDAETFYRKIVRFAVEDMRTDLVHFDNYAIGPGHDANSVARFRQYLRATFPAPLLKEHGIADVDAVMPPKPKDAALLVRAWADFCCQSLSDSFHSMTRYARSLRPDILMETNPAGIDRTVRWAVDHGRLLRGGEAFWDEGRHPGFANGQLTTRIRTFKAARGLNNSAFVYTINPLEAAESMAFNLDVLGCICWFEYDQLWEYPGNVRPMSPALLPFVKFYRQRHDLFRDAKVVADAGVFRSWPSMQFGPRETAKLPGEVEDLLIAHRGAFQLVFDTQLDELARWPALVLPGCVALSDAQVRALRAYVGGGGRLCAIGPLATHDEWMLPRAKPALDDLPAERIVRVDASGDWLDGIRRACGGQLSLSVACDSKALCAELTEQPNRRLVHLVNYQAGDPLKDVAVRVALPPGRRAKSVTLASPEHAADITVSFKQEAGFASFTVPAVGTYEIAVVTFQ